MNEVHSWKASVAAGNRWCQKVYREMLSNDGLIFSRWYRAPKSEGGGRKLHLIRYDTDYVFKKFEELFLLPLGFTMSDFANAYYSWKVSSDPIQLPDAEVADEPMEDS